MRRDRPGGRPKGVSTTFIFREREGSSCTPPGGCPTPESVRHRLIARVRALIVLVAVTAVWGVTFVQVKDAVALHPPSAFLALRRRERHADARTGSGPVARLGPSRLPAGALAGALLGGGLCPPDGRPPADVGLLDRLITGMYVVLTPLLALVLFRVRASRPAWAGRLRLLGRGSFYSRASTGARPVEFCSCSRARRSTRCRSS